MPSDFVHLHVHTEYSLLDGQSQIDALMKRAGELDQPAIAITDHGVMFGAIDFFRAATAAGIKPIIGMEAYLAPRSMSDKDPVLDKKPYHLLLLAKNIEGYRNLCKLASEAQLTGYYYRPRVDKDLLAQYSGGIIATTGCLAAEIPKLVEEGRDEKALEMLGWYYEVFGAENFYLELQNHDIDLLHSLNKWLYDYRRSGHTPLKLLATNDVHYVKKDDWDNHDTLLCIQTGALKTDRNRMTLEPFGSYYLKSSEEMRREFAGAPEDMLREAFASTLDVAGMCDVNLNTEGYHLPIFPVPAGFTAAEYLRRLCEMGLGWRYPGREHDPALHQRLDHELKIIDDMGFNTYFLIVWDLCEFARSADIWWNVRGSGAGSLVAYCLGITGIDPIQNNLLFERFLNPGRVSMPDIDLDYPDNERGKMIAYATEKYGEDKVAAIITFGTMGAKASVKDVGRALGVELAKVNRAAAMIPQEAKQKPLQEYIDNNPELKKYYDDDPDIQRVMNTAMALQGMTRHASMHAAGVIISDKPLEEYIPLHRITGSTDSSDGVLKRVTQFPMETTESIGLLKVDFLGLSTLTILRKACELIEQHRGIKYTMENIPYRHDDPRITDEQRQMLDETFLMLGRGETVGVFQLESGGMQQMLRGMRPFKFEHIIAATSLYRPGPMEFIPLFNRRMHGEEATVYLHPKLEPILAETYGIMVYQEQLMQIASELFGYNMGEADLMRRAVSKKKEKDLLQHKGIFKERGPQYSVDEATAEKIFDEIEFFANYGFNRCVVGSTEIVDADTGRIITVEELFNNSVQVERTLSLDTDTLRLKPARITDVIANGVKPVYRLTTRTGRSIEATANHPFYTFEGWRNLEDLQPGERIAVPRVIPVEGQKEWDDYRLIVLGHLLAEGNLCHPTGIYYYTGDDEQLRDYVFHLEQFKNTRASVHTRCHNMHDVYSKRVNRSELAEIVTWIEELGLRNTGSYTKFIPDEVFELTKRQMGLLISRMWEGDGNIDTGKRSMYYATSSPILARQMQHLLLRLGIRGRVRKVIFPYKEGRTGYQVPITDNDNIALFNEYVAIHFVSEKRRCDVQGMVLSEVSSSGVSDIIPLQVKDIVRHEREVRSIAWKILEKETGLSLSTFSRLESGDKVGFTREVIGQLGEYFGSDVLRNYADSDIFWDTITSIEYTGEQPTYDLTIEGTHNFVANDIIVHNSHATDYAWVTLQTAYLKCHYPEEYMTALLCVHSDDSEKVATFLEECRRLHIPVLPPDVNYSMVEFDIETTADGQRAIRFGMGAIKHAGVGVVQHIIQKREEGGPFISLEDFCCRCDLRVVGKRAMESLIKVGALNSLHPDRHALFESLERIVGFSSDYHKAREIGQKSLFGDDAAVMETLNIPPARNPVSPREQLAQEKELLGLYVTGRPVDRHKDLFQSAPLNVIQRLKEAAGDEAQKAYVSGKKVRVAGEVVSLRKLVTKNNEMMCVFQLEDWHDTAGSIEVVAFPKTWLKVVEHFAGEGREFAPGEIVLVDGEFDTSRDTAQIKANRVTTKFEFVSGDTRHYLDDAALVGLSGNGHSRTMIDYDEEGNPIYAAEPSSPEFVPDGSNGNGGTGSRSHEDSAAFREFLGEKPLPTARHIRVYLNRSGDTDRDRRKLRRLHGILSQYPGRDGFSIVIEGGGQKSVTMEFPNHTTHYCRDLLDELAAEVGENGVIIR